MHCGLWLEWNQPIHVCNWINLVNHGGFYFLTLQFIVWPMRPSLSPYARGWHSVCSEFTEMGGVQHKITHSSSTTFLTNWRNHVSSLSFDKVTLIYPESCVTLSSFAKFAALSEVAKDDMQTLLWNISIAKYVSADLLFDVLPYFYWLINISNYWSALLLKMLKAFANWNV